jgi:uncharacterized protein YqeY
MLRSALKNKEIDRGKDKPLTDQDVLEVIQSGIKQRRESIEQYQKGGRPELVAKENEEIAILQTFLPAQLSESELDALVKAAAAEVGAASVKDMGKVMKAMMARVAGRAEGGAVSAAVKRTLEKLSTS